MKLETLVEFGKLLVDLGECVSDLDDFIGASKGLLPLIVTVAKHLVEIGEEALVLKQHFDECTAKFVATYESYKAFVHQVRLLCELSWFRASHLKLSSCLGCHCSIQAYVRYLRDNLQACQRSFEAFESSLKELDKACWDTLEMSREKSSSRWMKESSLLSVLVDIVPVLARLFMRAAKKFVKWMGVTGMMKFYRKYKSTEKELKDVQKESEDLKEEIERVGKKMAHARESLEAIAQAVEDVESVFEHGVSCCGGTMSSTIRFEEFRGQLRGVKVVADTSHQQVNEILHSHQNQ